MTVLDVGAAVIEFVLVNVAKRLDPTKVPALDTAAL
jgi:hypothetical protein